MMVLLIGIGDLGFGIITSNFLGKSRGGLEGVSIESDVVSVSGR
jgi:hypothetical protein